jgi:microcystin-dependent protein
MALVEVLNKARMLAIEAASVVSGVIDESGHLILSRYDESTIDAGSALPALPISDDTTQGIVELATNAETITGTDASRAVTPASLASTRSLSLIGIPGEIRIWSGSSNSGSLPEGWLICNGDAISRTTYSTLYSVIGTTYGSGDGSTTFNIPNLKGRVPVGYDSSQSEFDSRGDVGGEKTHTLSSDEMPSHTHVQDAHSHNFSGATSGALTDGPNGTYYGLANGSYYGFRGTQPPATTATNQSTGGGSAHNNLQPYLTIHYIIKT